MIIGSCFAENIGKRLVACKFPALLNPFGILYNPLSIAEAVRRIVDGRLFTEESPELVFHGERWHSMLHHGDFSRRDKGDVISAVNASIEHARSFLRGADLLTLTFGTAYVYRRKSDNMVVGNCHKIPGSEFTLDVDTVVMSIGTSPNPLIKSTTEGLEVNRWGGIIVTEDGETTRAGVYAGGDAVTGAATVISAMGAGKIAANAIHSKLSN